MVYNLNTKETKAATDEWYNASSPAFDPTGKYLSLSQRVILTPPTVGPNGIMCITI